MKNILYIIILSFIFSFSVFANKEVYELQERCGKRAAETFKNLYGNKSYKGKDINIDIMRYRNHYSTKLNKCFSLDISEGFTLNDDKKESRFYMETLFDINENKEYGNYYEQEGMTLVCSLEDNFCHSRKEWENLLKQYMED